MIKRLIFDLDNTLVLWKDEYRDAVKKTLVKFNIDIDSKLIDNIFENYENLYDTLTKEKLLEEINTKCNLNLNMDFMEDLIKEEQELSEYNSDMIDLFEYLSSKYEIVLLTNWFLEVQEKRLEKVGILKYFNELYGAENTKLKPTEEAFIKAIGNRKPDECIMIGDNIKIDLEEAAILNINTILVDLKNKYSNTSFETINNIYDLKEML